MDRTWTAVLQQSPSRGGWTCVVLPGTAELFGTRGRVAVRVAVDGHPYRTSFMALGDGTHKLPVKAEVRRAIGKQAGDEVEVRLLERLSPDAASPDRVSPDPVSPDPVSPDPVSAASAAG